MSIIADPYIDRKYIIGSFFCFIFIIYISRLYYIQIIDDQYKFDAKNNTFRNRTDYPPRGYIYDRNNELLVYNEISHDLLVTPKLVKQCDTNLLCQILEILKLEFVQKIRKFSLPPNSPRKEYVFEKQLSKQSFALIQEKLYRFQGFDLQKRTIRKYKYPSAAQLLGYVGEANKQVIAQNPYYKEGDYVGISGIEKSYEAYLRGKKGVKIIMVDVHNKTKGNYMNGAFDTLAQPGIPLHSTIDIGLQAYGEKLMSGKKGAIVAIEPSTGEILCLVSSPSYDPNLLVGGKERNKNFTKLFYDTLKKPLFNRAIQGMYPPGSTFKIIDALIALNDSVITKTTKYPCLGGYPPMGGRPKCHPHAAQDLPGAIAHSCNSYFCYVFREIVDHKKHDSFEEGYNYWRECVKSFGPNTHLGGDLPYDRPGNLPSITYYNKVFGKNHWRSNTVISLGIGQAELTLVPLQMANVIASVANRGYYYTPHCIKSIGIEKRENKKFKVKHYTHVQSAYAYDLVHDGMQMCVDQGTGFMSKIKNVEVCGKTGTAENPHGDSHAVFLAFAPRQNPKIAIVCLVENAGFGGTWSAPIVGLMIEKYLTGKVSNLDLETRIVNSDLINRKNLISNEHH